MIQMFLVEVDTGMDDDDGVTVEQIEEALVGTKAENLGAIATVIVTYEGEA